ncbi:MAG: pilus assembly protein [Rhizobiales bacterium]|nr:pilus assembly protein [Hyphomicrobiales bacterium]NRB14224.1 pilus assembly protein [Hyphomicrobiales bacterium]
MKKLLSKFKPFLRDQSGVASIEFTIIFPVLITLFFGCIELYGHIHAVRKLGNITSSIADIVAQSSSISTAQLNALHPLVKTLVAPLDSTEIRYRISSVRQGNAGDTPKLIWQHINGSKNAEGKIIVGGAEYEGAPCGDFTATEGKEFPENQDSIFVTVEFTYSSPFGKYLAGTVEYSDSMIAIPRSTKTVSLSDKTACI